MERAKSGVQYVNVQTGVSICRLYILCASSLWLDPRRFEATDFLQLSISFLH